MAFTPEVAKVPAAIGDIAVVLTDHDGASPDEARYEVQVLQADGTLFRLAQGDLIPHLSAAQVQGLLALMADLRQKAQALLPVPE